MKKLTELVETAINRIKIEYHKPKYRRELKDKPDIFRQIGYDIIGGVPPIFYLIDRESRYNAFKEVWTKFVRTSHENRTPTLYLIDRESEDSTPKKVSGDNVGTSRSQQNFPIYSEAIKGEVVPDWAVGTSMSSLMTKKDKKLGIGDLLGLYIGLQVDKEMNKLR